MTSGTAPPVAPQEQGDSQERRQGLAGAAAIVASLSGSPTSGGAVSLRRRALGALPAALLGLVTLALWQLARSTDAAPALFLPAPADVVRSFWLLVTLPQFRGAIVGTVIVSLGGCALGVVVALPLGYVIARSPLVAVAVQPYLAASQALPIVALAPLIALWLGYGLEPRLAICALIVFFPLVVITTLGLRGLDRDVLDAARVEGADRWVLLWRIELPLALPSILAGLRASLTLSITGAVIGDFALGSDTGPFDQGLGGLLSQFLGATNSAGVFATLILLSLLAAIYYGLARLAERRLSYLEAR